MRVWCLILVLVMHACLLPRTWLAQARAEMGPTAPHCPTCALLPACPLCEGALGEAEFGGGCCCGGGREVVMPPASGEIGAGCDSCRCEAWPLDPQPTNGSTIPATAGSGAWASNALMAMAASPWILRLDWPTFVGSTRGTHADRVGPGVVPRSVSCVRVV